MSSGFEFSEAIEVTVFRRSLVLGGGLGAGTVSLLAEPLLESHEKLIPSFLGAGVGEGVGTVALGARGGGGPQGMDGRFPERPWPLNGSFGGDAAVLFSVDVVGVESDCIELLSLVPSSWTSSSEVAEIRCAVSNGDFGGTSGSYECGGFSPRACIESSASVASAPPFTVREVERVDEGRLSVNERTVSEDSCD